MMEFQRTDKMIVSELAVLHNGSNELAAELSSRMSPYYAQSDSVFEEIDEFISQILTGG